MKWSYLGGWIVCATLALNMAACTRQSAKPTSEKPPEDLVQPLIDKEKAEEKGDKNGSLNSDPSDRDPLKDGPTPKDIEKANNKIIDNTLAHMQPPAKPKTEGWTAASISPADLGSKLDSSIGSLKDTVGKFDLYVKSKKLTGSVASRFQVVDKDKYSIEIYSPAKPVESRRIVSNGQVTAVFSKDGWQKRTAGEAPQVTLPKSKLVAQWMRDFPEWTFGNLTDDVPTWKALLSALGGPKSGFQTAIEQRTMKVNGDSKLFYRILTTSAKDKNLLIEIRIDANRMLPVSIIVNQDPDTATQWFASYGFHQPMKEESFVIPSNL